MRARDDQINAKNKDDNITGLLIKFSIKFTKSIIQREISKPPKVLYQ